MFCEIIYEWKGIQRAVVIQGYLQRIMILCVSLIVFSKWKNNYVKRYLN